MSSPGNEGWFEMQEREFQAELDRQRAERYAFARTPEGRSLIREFSRLMNASLPETDERENENQSATACRGSTPRADFNGINSTIKEKRIDTDAEETTT